jgi:hypothetical protein
MLREGRVMQADAIKTASEIATHSNLFDSRLAEETALAVLASLADVERCHRPVIAHDPRPHFATLTLVVVQNDLRGGFDLLCVHLKLLVKHSCLGYGCLLMLNITLFIVLLFYTTQRLRPARFKPAPTLVVSSSPRALHRTSGKIRVHRQDNHAPDKSKTSASP